MTPPNWLSKAIRNYTGKRIPTFFAEIVFIGPGRALLVVVLAVAPGQGIGVLARHLMRPRTAGGLARMGHVTDDAQIVVVSAQAA